MANYIYNGDPKDIDIQFYRLYDPQFIMSAATILLSGIKNPERCKQQLTEDGVGESGISVNDRFFHDLQSELYFAELHQFESFFALLIAPFQALPHWIFLSIYGTQDVQKSIEQYCEGQIEELTHGMHQSRKSFVQHAVYTFYQMKDPEGEVGKWEENLENVVGVIEALARRYQDGLFAYNSYKHGLRVMSLPSSLTMAAHRDDGSLGPASVFSLANSLTYLEREKVGGGDWVMHRVTKEFDPDASFYCLSIMHLLLETVRVTRLAFLEGRTSEPQDLNTFFDLDLGDPRLHRSVTGWRFNL